MKQQQAWILWGAFLLAQVVFGAVGVSMLLQFKNHVPFGGLVPQDFAGIGMALGVGGVGALIAASITPAATRAMGKNAWIVGAYGVLGTTAGLVLLVDRPWSMILASFFLGFAGQAVKVCADTIAQETIDESFQGRTFAVYDTSFNVSFVIGVVLGTVLLPDSGRNAWFFISIAVLYAAVALLYRVIALKHEVRLYRLAALRAADDPVEPRLAHLVDQLDGRHRPEIVDAGVALGLPGDVRRPEVEHVTDARRIDCGAGLRVAGGHRVEPLQDGEYLRPGRLADVGPRHRHPFERVGEGAAVRRDGEHDRAILDQPRQPAEQLALVSGDQAGQVTEDAVRVGPLVRPSRLLHRGGHAG